MPSEEGWGKNGRHGSQRRVTISDIAARAGISKVAVSYALNDRDGVSEQTRTKVKQLAAQLGWRPSSAAKALSINRAGACGLVVARPALSVAVEPFWMKVISGIEAELSSRSIDLVLRLADGAEQEMEVHRRWWGERRVDGVLLGDLLVDDPRLPQARALGLPAVLLATGALAGPSFDGPIGSIDDEVAMAHVVDYLAELGHRRLARVAGARQMVHTHRRTASFRRAVRARGARGQVVSTDFTAERSAEATRRLLAQDDPPSAIVYENDIMAVAGLRVIRHAGRRVPDDLSIVSFEDSLYCEVVDPPLTAVSRDAAWLGARAAGTLADLVEGRPSGPPAPLQAILTRRGSTGPPSRL